MFLLICNPVHLRAVFSLYWYLVVLATLQSYSSLSPPNGIVHSEGLLHLAGQRNKDRQRDREQSDS